MPLPGLLLWIGAGVVIGVATPHVVPHPTLGRWWSLALGIVGALAGGALATVLGFGGLASMDVRSVVVAALASLLLVLGAEVASGAGPHSAG